MITERDERLAIAEGAAIGRGLVSQSLAAHVIERTFSSPCRCDRVLDGSKRIPSQLDIVIANRCRLVAWPPKTSIEVLCARSRRAPGRFRYKNVCRTFRVRTSVPNSHAPCGNQSGDAAFLTRRAAKWCHRSAGSAPILEACLALSHPYGRSRSLVRNCILIRGIPMPRASPQEALHCSIS